MFLTHLATDRGLPVHDPRSSSLLFWTSDATVKRLISEAKIRPIFGAKHCVRALHWIGAALTIVPIPEEVAGYKPSNWQPIAYVYDYETSVNPKNCWSFVEVHSGDRNIFLAVVLECVTNRPPPG